MLVRQGTAPNFLPRILISLEKCGDLLFIKKLRFRGGSRTGRILSYF